MSGAASGTGPCDGAAARAERECEIARLRRINAALVERVERTLDQQGNAFSLFQTAIGLEAQVRQRTAELERTLVDLERSNAELARARDAAETADRSKTRFLAAASHDVLQPLNAAALSMSSLASMQTSAEGVGLCGQVERSLGTMDALLRTLLYMSRLDAGDVVPRIAAVSLDALFESIASDFEPVARQRSLELRVRRSGLHVRSDATMLRRILQNIVANALRYTRSGGVLLVAARRGAEVHVRVADTGVGIPKARLDDVFVEFRRCADPGDADPDDPDDEPGSGLGLGLAIVERTARALDHRITLNSRPGRGSCFGLDLGRPVPAPSESPDSAGPTGTVDAAATRRPAATGAGTGLDGARVLVVENDPDARRAMERLFGQWGCLVRTVADGAGAVAAVEAGCWRPDLIVADQHLDAGERGATIVARLRRRLHAPVPALLVTADPSPALRARAAREGVELMRKPLRPARLRALMAHMRDARGRGERRAASEAETDATSASA